MNALRFILFPFAAIYWLVTSIRNFLFKKNIFKSNAFDLPIINIGNLSMGGAGKTPHCEYIINLLEKDFNIAMLSRGYGRKTASYKEVNTFDNYLDVGDEPLQVKTKFPTITVAVESKRVKGVLNLLYDHPKTGVIVLDDAYQHRSIKPGLNILLTKYNTPYYKDFIFPVGSLRESSKGSSRADIIIYTKCPDSLSKEEMENMKKRIDNSAEVYFTKIKYGEIVPLFNSPKLVLNSSTNILLITGIAATNEITKKLKQQKLRFKHLKYRDHYPFSEKDTNKISEIFDTFASVNKIILTTEKDAMRMKGIESFKSLPIYYIPINIEFISERENFDQKIINYAANN